MSVLILLCVRACVPYAIDMHTDIRSLNSAILLKLIVKLASTTSIFFVCMFVCVCTPPQDIAWIEGFAILVAVVIVVFITALNDWTKDKQFRGLQKKLDSDTRFSVLRDEEFHELPLVELVVGDIAQFKYGNTFPVDGILIQVGVATQP